MDEPKRLNNLFSQLCLILILLIQPLNIEAQVEALFFQRLSVAENLTAQKYNYYVFKGNY